LVKEDLTGIVTKKDLIKPIIEEEREGIEAIIVGKENVPSYYQSYLEEYVRRFISKAKKMFEKGFLKVVIEKHRDIYSIHLTFSDYKHTFRASRERREFLDVLQECFDILEEQVFEKNVEKNKRIKEKLLEYLKQF